MLERLLEAWVELPPSSRDLLVKLAQELLDRPSTHPTVVVPPPANSQPRAKRCPDCQIEITDLSYRYCGACGCPLPEWSTY